MYNMILDRLPTEYEGYLIRTSFRIGIQISLCMSDDDYTEEEKLYTVFSLLYGSGMPEDLDLAYDGLVWFMSCGNPPKKNQKQDVQKELFYWDFDNARLYSSFMSTYNIDITKEDMHWFKFIALIGSLNENCAFNQAIQIRDYDVRELKGKSRSEMLKLQRELTPEIEYTEEEQAEIDKFEALLAGGDVNG